MSAEPLSEGVKRERRTQEQIRVDNFNEHLASMNLEQKVALWKQLKESISNEVERAKSFAELAMQTADGIL